LIKLLTSVYGFLPILFLPLLCVPARSQAHLHEDVVITIHIRGVYGSKISLLGRNDSRIYKPIRELPEARSGETARLIVPGNMLPGEFVLRFDYKEKEEGTPYPSEKYFFVNDQDLELWVSPMYCNNPDSTWFQKNERENNAFARFSQENGKKKEKLGLLQNFLMNYDDTQSEFYKQGIIEYEKRRQVYNQWLSDCIKTDRALFVSNLYQFEYVPDIPWQGTEEERVRSIITHYFDGVDFTNPLIIKATDLVKWMDTYVNLYGQLATTAALRDSLLSEAGRTAIERSKKGDPLVYGWMVDYFYKGYESNGIDAGMKVLEPYLNDPNCLTSKRLEISRRLEGIKTLLPGTKAPDIRVIDSGNKIFDLYDFKTSSKYLLILFWSAGCSHCAELVANLFPWQQQAEMKDKISVVAVSLDETETDIKLWKEKIKDLSGWVNMNEPEGVRSKSANDYYILSTPVMILVDPETKKIIALPGSLQDLIPQIK
jgi:thioredoxin-related protein